MSSPLQDPVPLSDVRRALVTKLRHHGDVLLASPVFTTLARAAPHVEIDALVYAETAPMLEGHPSIALLHTIDRDWKRRGVTRQAVHEIRLARALRARRYDLLIHLTEHPRGLTLARVLGPRYAVTRERPRAAISRTSTACRAPRRATRSRRTSMRCAASASIPPTTTSAWCSSRAHRRTSGSTRCSRNTGLRRAGSCRSIPARDGCSNARPPRTPPRSSID
jgi:hypothetical protein